MSNIFQKIFPCRFNEPLCKNNFFGCRCGKGKKEEEPAPAQTPAPAPSAEEQFQALLSAGQIPTGSTFAGVGEGGVIQYTPPAPPPTQWNKYWTTISGSIPQEQVATWMNQWSNDPNFPWGEVVQDYANVAAGEQPAFGITPEGGLQMKYNPYSPPGGKLGTMTPELATPFNWNEGQINQFNQNLAMKSNVPQALYPFAARIIKEREAARGVGEAPMTARNIPIGGQLLGAGASAISPTSLITGAGGQGGVNPLTLTELIQQIGS